MLNGIDVSGYQAGIDLARVPCDFVIVKISEGTNFLSKDRVRQVNQALAAGRGVGLYHYVNGKAGAVAEADFFLANCAPWLTRGVVLAIDWENGGNRAWGDLTYLRRVLSRVKERTGKAPVLYASSSAFPWSLAAELKCPRWIAQYASSNPTHGYKATPWHKGWTPRAGDIFQYSGTGRLSGWGANLDLNLFYGTRADWNRMAVGTDGQTIALDTSDTAAPAAPTIKRDDMHLISTQLSDGSWAYALITETSGATTLDDQQRGAYITMLGDAKAYPWDWYWMLIREAWERRNALASMVGTANAESADDVVARLKADLDSRGLAAAPVPATTSQEA